MVRVGGSVACPWRSVVRFRTVMTLALVGATYLTCASVTLGQSVGPSTRWAGTVFLPGDPMPMVLTLRGDSATRATLDLPDMWRSEVPLSVARDGDSLSFQFGRPG